jgi:hypothetical protein
LRRDIVDEAKKLREGKRLKIPSLPTCYPDLNITNPSEANLIAAQVLSFDAHAKKKLEKRAFLTSHLLQDLAEKISSDQELQTAAFSTLHGHRALNALVPQANPFDDMMIDLKFILDSEALRV